MSVVGLFASDSIDVSTELPVLQIVSLGISKTAVAANDPFYVRTGLRNPAVTGTSFWGLQPVSAAGGTVEVLLTVPSFSLSEALTNPLAKPGLPLLSVLVRQALNSSVPGQTNYRYL